MRNNFTVRAKVKVRLRPFGERSVSHSPQPLATLGSPLVSIRGNGGTSSASAPEDTRKLKSNRSLVWELALQGFLLLLWHDPWWPLIQRSTPTFIVGLVAVGALQEKVPLLGSAGGWNQGRAAESCVPVEHVCSAWTVVLAVVMLFASLFNKAPDGMISGNGDRLPSFAVRDYRPTVPTGTQGGTRDGGNYVNLHANYNYLRLILCSELNYGCYLLSSAL